LVDLNSKAERQETENVTVENIKQKAGAFAEKARRNGYIGIDELNYVLAVDEQYGDVLGVLWKQYQLNKRDKDVPKTDTARERLIVWQKLLSRLSFGLVAGISSGIKIESRYMQIHNFNEETGNFEPSTAWKYFNQHGHGAAFISLKEIKTYFAGILEIPLPSMLFPPEAQQEYHDSKALGHHYIQKGIDRYKIKFDEEYGEVSLLKGMNLGRKMHTPAMDRHKSENRPCEAWHFQAGKPGQL